MENLALALTNETKDVASDALAMYLFEKQISQVRSLPTLSNLDTFSYSVIQYHWTSAEQRLRDNETIRTTVGNLPTALKSIVRLFVRSCDALRMMTFRI